MSSTVNEESEFSIEFTRGPTVTICELAIFNDRNNVRVYVGESKKHPKDEYNDDIGDLYAISRAFKAVADETERIADGYVAEAQEALVGDVMTTILDFLAGMVEEILPEEEETEEDVGDVSWATDIKPDSEVIFNGQDISTFMSATERVECICGQDHSEDRGTFIQ